MHHVTLICTTHQPVGQCNPIELYKLVLKYQPEVIFEELPPSIYEECYIKPKYGYLYRTTLETDAVKMYMQNHSLKHVPVVDESLSAEFNQTHEKMVNVPQWRKLIDDLEMFGMHDGFNFLNSGYAEQLFENIKYVEQQVINYYDDPDLLKIYELGKQSIDEYENGIIKNIYQYSKENQYDTGLMFIGSAHRKSIIEKIIKYNEASDLILNWTFYNPSNYVSMAAFLNASKSYV